MRQLRDQWNLHPLPVSDRAKKHPYVDWNDYKHTEPSNEEINHWWGPGSQNDAWTEVGSRRGWLVLDIDNEQAHELWRERLGDLLDRTALVRSRKGWHYWFSIEVGSVWPPWKHLSDPEAKKRGARFDIQGQGTGVMLPPSLFPEPSDDGRRQYEWVRGLECALPAPQSLQKPRGTVQAVNATPPRETLGSRLADALNSPPDEGGRNDWHTTVAGHLAKLIPYEDGYLALAALVNDALPSPLDMGEVLKTWGSVWSKERAKGVKGRAESGWLASDGNTLHTTVDLKTEDGKTRAAKPWLNGDLRVQGVIVGKDSARSYVVELRPHNRSPIVDIVRGSVFGSSQETRKWLSRYGMSIAATDEGTEVAERSGIGERLTRYFESFNPPEHQSVMHLGWHDDIGFVTHEGVITAEGMQPHSTVIPDPELRRSAPYVYGMGDVEETKRILAEILSYQEPWVAAVFGSWWVMCFLKGQTMVETGHFPYMIIEAASEAGKTRGMFSLLRTLAGSTQHGTGTKASIRDSMGVHRSGLVHIDDAQSVDHLEELLREAPGEGYWTKKDGDNSGTINIKLVAPVMLSGESLGGLRGEKAHRDRSIILEGILSPKGRMSMYDPTRPQIDDVMAMMNQDLSQFTGTMVQLALQQAHLVHTIKQLRGKAGRHNEVMAIVKCGALVLDAILEREWAEPLVRAWIGGQDDLGHENTLVTKVLPWVLLESRSDLWGKLSPMYYSFQDGPDGMWVHVPTVSAEWQKETRRRGINDRLSSPEALIAQLKAMGAEFKQKSINGKKPKCWQLPAEYRKAVYLHAGLEIDPVADRLAARFSMGTR